MAGSPIYSCTDPDPNVVVCTVELGEPDEIVDAESHRWCDVGV